MINQRYILPATISAVFHAALLFGFPGKTIRDVVTVTEVTLIGDPPRPPDETVVPPRDKGDTTTPVRELAGGPRPPDLEPPPPGGRKINDITIPEVNRPRNPARLLTDIPKISGPGEGIEWTGNALPPAIDYRGLDHAPRAKVQPAPVYPARLRQDGISGAVEVGFEVGTTGHVVRAEATHYTHREFVEPALRAVWLWRFEPGTHHGKVVPFRMAVPIEFGLER